MLGWDFLDQFLGIDALAYSTNHSTYGTNGMPLISEKAGMMATMIFSESSVIILIITLTITFLSDRSEGYKFHNIQLRWPQTRSFRHERERACCRKSSLLFRSSVCRSATSPPCDGYSINDSFNLIVLGDLHLEDDMSEHYAARQDCLDALERLSLLPSPPASSIRDVSTHDARASELFVSGQLLEALKEVKAGDLSVTQLEMLLEYKKEMERNKSCKFLKCHLVSLGDLGRKDIRHEPGDAGTTLSFQQAKSFFEGFGGIPYEVVTGNHDLEGLDEFQSDAENLNAFLQVFQKPTPQFCKQVGEKTILVGLSTVRFRDSPFSSHECHVDDEQLSWFLDLLKGHPANEGWKILVFTHAPIMGSGLRVLQNVHVQNGCAWLNHCCERTRKTFIEAVKEHPQIKLWFSGHFHLSHDYEDSLSTQGSCTFCQLGVMGKASTRDGRRQSRIVQGASDRIKVYTVNHHKRDETTGAAELRLDAEIDIVEDKITLFSRQNAQDYNNEDWFRAYTPEPEDGCYLAMPNGQVACSQTVQKAVCWWHMQDGKVLGLHEGQLIEYDAESLSPLGIVVSQATLAGREILVVEEGKAVVMVGPNKNDVEVVHPNEDGSYWRRVQRNKRVRQEEKAREEIAKMWLQKQK